MPLSFGDDRSPDGEMVVSTVFLGMDHCCGGDGPPVLFESMHFGPDDENGDCERCCTWEDAELLHEAMCARYGLDPRCLWRGLTRRYTRGMHKFPPEALDARLLIDGMKGAELAGILALSRDPWLRAAMARRCPWRSLGLHAAPLHDRQDPELMWPVLLLEVWAAGGVGAVAPSLAGKVRQAIVTPPGRGQDSWGSASFLKLNMPQGAYLGDRAGPAGLVNGDPPTPKQCPPAALAG